jgi:uncharacterized protein YidB (DUF937 family)
MGLLDQLGGSLKGVLGSVAAAEAPALISAALASNGTNLQVTPEQIQSALGSDQVKQLAQHFGVSPDAVAKLLADHLPAAVDQASPDGSVQGS